MGTAIYNPTAQINQLNTANKKSATADLTTAKNLSLANINTARATIEPEYLKQRNTVDTNSQVQARNFAEFMANRGQNNVAGMNGSLAQNTIASGAMRQGNLGSLATGEAKAFTENTKQSTDVGTAYNAAVASSNAKIDAATLGQMITSIADYNSKVIAQENYNTNRADTLAQQAKENARADESLALQKQSAARSSSGGGGGSSSGGSSGKAPTAAELRAEATANAKSGSVENTAKTMQYLDDWTRGKATDQNGRADVNDLYQYVKANSGNLIRGGVDVTALDNWIKTNYTWVKTPAGILQQANTTNY